MGLRPGRVGVTSALGLVCTGLAVSFVQCFSEEDTSVEIVTTCDVNKLDTKVPAQATVKVYVDTATQLRDRAKDILERFRGVCNNMNQELGLPPGGDVHAACNQIADRVAKTQAIGVVNGATLGEFGSPWVFVIVNDRCVPDMAAEAKCLDSCADAPGCDPLKGCTAPSGVCAGKCTGTCTTAGPAVPCSGACIGKCANPPPNEAPEAGVPACFFPDGRECSGKCLVPFWQGRCTTGCADKFHGVCSGTCTGSCNGTPYPRVALDGGAVDAGDDGGDAGGGDAGDGTGPGSGTCNGTCDGACSGPASGICGAPCDGDFTGGGCPVCVGTCTGIAIPCTTTCDGVCIQAAEQCQGGCSKCEGTVSNSACTEGQFACGAGTAGGGGEANLICKGVCRMQGALAAQCGKDPSPSVQVAGDYQLYDVIKKHASDFSAMVREVKVIETNLGGITQRTPGEFRDIGVVLDNSRKCAESAGPTYEEARKLVNEAIGASLVLRGAKF